MAEPVLVGWAPPSTVPPFTAHSWRRSTKVGHLGPARTGGAGRRDQGLTTRTLAGAATTRGVTRRRPRSDQLGAQVVRAVGAGGLVVDAPAAAGHRHQAEVPQAVRSVRTAQRFTPLGGELTEAAVRQAGAVGDAGA